ncbi:hypothetical protein [Streptomyces sp. NPDC007083]|uniref:hypothetical protein n=1 Tax=unclassified Streptomyces TaxID=2593676 RepID=UPI0033D52240
MRIRTATAAAVLATAAVLGSAGTAFAGNSWNSYAQDFSDHILNARVSSSDNDTTTVKTFQNYHIHDNVVTNINSGLAIGELELD